MKKYITSIFFMFLVLHLFAQNSNLYEEYYYGEDVYTVLNKTGIMDIYRYGEKEFSFRQQVVLPDFYERYNLDYIGNIDSETEIEFLGLMYGSNDIIVKIEKGDSRSTGQWLFYLEILSPLYTLGNGIQIGMSVKEFANIMKITDVINEKIIFLENSGMAYPYKYGYLIDGMGLDTLDNIIIFEWSDACLSKIIFLVRHGYFVP